MRGYKRERKPGVWQLVATLPIGGQKYRQVSRTFHGTARQADRELNKLVREVDEGRHRGQAATLAALVERWITDAGYEPSTRKLVRRLLEHHIRRYPIGDRDVRELRPADLTGYYQQLAQHGGPDGTPLAASTVRRVHALIRRAFGHGIHLEWCFVNPAANARLPRKDDRDEQKPPTPDELARLFRAAREGSGKQFAGLPDPAWEVFLRLLAGTGARRGELCGLRWSRVDLERGAVEIARAIGEADRGTYEKTTKTRQTRVVPVGSGTLSVLREHRARVAQRAAAFGVPVDDDGYVFSNDPECRTHWEPRAVTNRFPRTRELAGLRPFRLHDLRHFVGSYLIDSGQPVTAVSKLLGHDRESTTTDIYGHALDARIRLAAEAIDRILTPDS